MNSCVYICTHTHTSSRYIPVTLPPTSYTLPHTSPRRCKTLAHKPPPPPPSDNSLCPLSAHGRSRNKKRPRASGPRRYRGCCHVGAGKGGVQGFPGFLGDRGRGSTIKIAQTVLTRIWHGTYVCIQKTGTRMHFAFFGSDLLSSTPASGRNGTRMFFATFCASINYLTTHRIIR